MSGYGTLKRHTTPLNLGFPRAFETTYATYGQPPAWEPEEHFNSTFDDVGDDFQASWHEQKRKDAHYMADQKVHSTRMMNQRANESHAGYYKMPKPVLGQRRYANPSLGANSHSHATAREDQPGAPWTIQYNPVKFNNGGLQGGVLRSSAGQRYGKQILNARIGQLNEIEKGLTTFSAASAGLGDAPKTRFPGATGNEFNNELTSVSLVELAQLLQSVLDSTTASGGDIARFEVKDSVRAFALIVRAATDNTVSDIANILEFIRGHSNSDGIVPGLDNLISSHMEHINEENPEDPFIKRVFTLKLFWENIAEYLVEMLKARHENRPKASIQALSKALVDKLGFTRFIKDVASSNLGNAPIRPPPEFLDNYNGKFNQEAARTIYNRAGRSGAFINPSQSREDSEHGGKLATNPHDELDADDPNRTLYANSSGANQQVLPPGVKTGGRGQQAAWSAINQTEVKGEETIAEKEAKNEAVDAALAREGEKNEAEAIEKEVAGAESPGDKELAELFNSVDGILKNIKNGTSRKLIVGLVDKILVPRANKYEKKYAEEGWAEDFLSDNLDKINDALDERDKTPSSPIPEAKGAQKKKSDVEEKDDGDISEKNLSKKIDDLYKYILSVADKEEDNDEEVNRLWNKELTPLLNLYGSEYMASGAMEERSDEMWANIVERYQAKDAKVAQKKKSDVEEEEEEGSDIEAAKKELEKDVNRLGGTLALKSAIELIIANNWTRLIYSDKDVKKAGSVRDYISQNVPELLLELAGGYEDYTDIVTAVFDAMMNAGHTEDQILAAEARLSEEGYDMFNSSLEESGKYIQSASGEWKKKSEEEGDSALKLMEELKPPKAAPSKLEEIASSLTGRPPALPALPASPPPAAKPKKEAKPPHMPDILWGVRSHGELGKYSKREFKKLNLEQLREFIDEAKKKHPEYTQNYKAKEDADPNYLRRVILKKLREAGLLETGE